MTPPVVRTITAPESRPLRRAVLRPHDTDEELRSREPADAHYVGVEVDGAIVAVGRIRPEGDDGAWRLNGMATAPAWRGHGHGGRVLRALIDHARIQGARAVWCTARADASGFYERAGLTVVGVAHDDPATGRHVLMRRALD